MQIKSVLYVTTQVTGTWRYFSYCCYPSIWYTRIQKKVIDMGLSNDALNFQIKFYPNDLIENPNIHYVREHYPEREKKESLIELLTNHRFDLVITEASATTLLEILCTKSQVLLFVPKDYMNLDRAAIATLEKRAFFAENEEDYLNTIQQLCDPSEKIKPKPLDNEFLYTFGLGQRKDTPHQLAANHLYDIIQETQGNDGR